jgi:DNA uptake protein ComE-like DNA-binding protein
MTPEEKLCSRTWRLRNSAGLLWSILSVGFLTGVGFLFRGIKAKNKLWIGLGIGFLALGIGLMVTAGTFDAGTKEAPKTSVASTIWGWIWFTTFIGGLVASFVTNKKWLIWKAHTSSVKWYAQAGVSQPAGNPSPARGYDPNAAAAAFASPAPAPTVAPQASSNEGLDVNTASAGDLVTALGVDQPTANRIIDARQGTGSFTSFEQLMSKAQVPPHLLIPHRSKLIFGAPQQSAPVPSPASAPMNSGTQSARRLDL